MSISVQDDLYEYIRERAEKDHFGSVSDYVRWLVYCDSKGKIQTPSKENAKARVRTMNESMMVGMFEEFLDHYYQK
jgi:Arc/MetJ-type ribon-helix-helix transcriptional regulator